MITHRLAQHAQNGGAAGARAERPGVEPLTPAELAATIADTTGSPGPLVPIPDRDPLTPLPFEQWTAWDVPDLGQ